MAWTKVGNLSPSVPDTPEPYVRPADWLPLPAVNVGDQKFVGLVAVFNNDSNYLSLQAAGAYTVDWGDGTAPENIATNTQANHQYVYANIPSGTTTSEGFRQVIVTVTPQGAGNLTSLDFNKRAAGLPANISSGLLDIRMAGASLTSLTLSGGLGAVKHVYLEQFEFIGSIAATSIGNLFYDCRALRKVIIPGPSWTANMVTVYQLYSNCSSLQEVPMMDTSKCTGMFSMFQGCSALKSVPPLDYSKATNLQSMFNGCSSLVTIPDMSTPASTALNSMFLGCVRLAAVPNGLDTSKATTVASMFQGCSSLESVPALNTSVCTTFTSMFNGCTKLAAVPTLNTSQGTVFSSMFQNCYRLKTVPMMDTSKGTGASFDSMFQGCSLLKSVPAIDTTLSTTMSNFLNGCSSLKSVPAFNTSNVTNFSNMFNGCSLLKTVPMMDTSKGTTLSSMFSGCASLIEIPPLVVSSATTLGTTVFNGCSALTKGTLVGAKVSIGYANCLLSAASLNDIYTNLASGVTGQTITVTGNPGIAGDNPSIATAKGWTVTGS